MSALPRTPKPVASVFLGLAEKDSLNGSQGCLEAIEVLEMTKGVGL